MGLRAAGPDGSATLPGLSVAPFPIDRWSTRYDLELYAGQDGDGLSGMFVYNTDLFDADTIARLAGHLETLLRQVSGRPALRLSEDRPADRGRAPARPVAAERDRGPVSLGGSPRGGHLARPR